MLSTDMPDHCIIRMSAYGTIKRPQSCSTEPLSPTVWITDNTSRRGVAIYHLKKKAALLLPGLVEYMYETFSAVVEAGMTYPQEGDLDRDAFETYFFAEDVFLGLILSEGASIGLIDGQSVLPSMEEVKANRSWEESIGGFYYVRCQSFSGSNGH